MIVFLIFAVPVLAFSVWIYLRLAPRGTTLKDRARYETAVLVSELAGCIAAGALAYYTVGQSTNRAWWPIIALIYCSLLVPVVLFFATLFRKGIFRKEAPHLKTGRWGEKKAENFLKKAGYQILGRRVRAGRHDELDIIARQDDTLVFVEVKTRKNEQYGRPSAAVNRDKRRKLSRAAVSFLKKRRLRPPHIRFDIVEVIGEPDSGAPEIRHIENAFQLEGGYRIWW